MIKCSGSRTFGCRIFAGRTPRAGLSSKNVEGLGKACFSVPNTFVEYPLPIQSSIIFSMMNRDVYRNVEGSGLKGSRLGSGFHNLMSQESHVARIL